MDYNNIFQNKPFEQKPPMAFDERNKNVPIIPRVILNFPYPVRYCPFCEQELEVLNAVHQQENPELFKALLICLNPDCGAYDEEGHQAYVRVYYSSEESLQLFETTFLKIQKLEKS